ncbi:MAG: class I SAM-dependent methyltransferase [Solirubrobacteraceae bacterium]
MPAAGSSPHGAADTPAGAGPPPFHTIASRRAPARSLAIEVSRLLWRGRAESWELQGSTTLGGVFDAVVARCAESPGGIAVDLGCGSGQVTFPLAPGREHVLAVDINARAIEMLNEHARREGVTNITGIAHPVETLGLAPASVDLVVSNYALHHLRDEDKRLVVQRSFQWLRPGGRFVLGDMMFGRGADAEDRAIIRSKVVGLARLGPGGWWRIAKNAARFMLRFQERPLRPAAWEAMLREAGFADIRTERVVAEACVVSATKPAGTAVSATQPADTASH